MATNPNSEEGIAHGSAVGNKSNCHHSLPSLQQAWMAWTTYVDHVKFLNWPVLSPGRTIIPQLPPAPARQKGGTAAVTLLSMRLYRR